MKKVLISILLTIVVQFAWAQSNTIKGTVWEHNIVKINVNAKGDLVMTPRQGQEQFIFGEPVRVQEKLGLMKAYYESVEPACPGYHTVDLRYRGQLVCRK